ncbi:MAG: hypothetical protein FWG99_04515 [Treponema sp.]|nr:hypothetical protein [Treponema sp.]
MLKIKFFCSFFIALCAVSVFAQQNRTLNWSLGLQNVKTGELVSFSAPVQCRTGEQYRLIINPGAECFVYVIYQSSRGNDVGVIFYGNLINGAAWHSPSLELIDPQGTESLFIIVSQTEQRNLTQRISAFNNNSSASRRRALMNEVFRVRSNASRYREAPEKPVLMGGVARGSPEDGEGVEFSGLGTYVKTISLEH